MSLSLLVRFLACLFVRSYIRHNFGICRFDFFLTLVEFFFQSSHFSFISLYFIHELYKEYTALKYTIYNARCQYHSLDLRPNYGQELRTQELAWLVNEIQRYKTEMAALEEKLEKCQEEVETTNAEIMAYVRASE